MERVSVIEGDSPFLLVCPHGADDLGCTEITEEIAKALDSCAVINRGWERSPIFDYWNDKADCNDIRQLSSDDVLQEEFLNPILNSVSRIEKTYDFIYVIIIHGVGDQIRKVAKDQLDIILGFGAGNPPRYSCKPRIKNAFALSLLDKGLNVYEGKPGGRYSGAAKHNLNQLFRGGKNSWFRNPNVQSIQVEIIRELRQKNALELTVEALADCIDDLFDFDDSKEFDVDLKVI